MVADHFEVAIWGVTSVSIGVRSSHGRDGSKSVKDNLKDNEVKQNDARKEGSFREAATTAENSQSICTVNFGL